MSEVVDHPPTLVVQTDVQQVIITKESHDDVRLVNAAELRQEQTIVIASREVQYEVMSMGMQGPPGPPGVGDDEMPYAKRVDFEGDIIYRGEAVPGTANSDSLWRVRRIEVSPVDGDVDEKWAGGEATFVHSWDDRYTLEYI